MKRKLLQIVLFLAVCIPVQIVAAQSPNHGAGFAPTWGANQVKMAVHETSQNQVGKTISRVQATENLPSPVPGAPFFQEPNPPVTVAPENGFPMTTLPDDFGSQVGLDPNFEPQLGAEGMVVTEPSGEGSDAALEPLAQQQIRIDSPMEVTGEFVPNGFTESNGEIIDGGLIPEPMVDPSLGPIADPTVGPVGSAVATNNGATEGCNCELCQLKRAGYNVISCENIPAPHNRCDTKCVSPGSCPICDVGKFNYADCASSCPGGCQLGGWLAWGAYTNSHGIKGRNGNRPLGFNNIANQLQLHQAWLYAERPLNDAESQFSWGYRTDFMFGSDGPDTQAFGDGSWDESWDTSGEYGFAMPQLYLQASWQGWRAKVGRFYTIIGYEVVQATQNFFYSHAYTMYYNEPFTHTGVLFDRQVTDEIKLYAGWTAGWDSGFANRFGGSTFLGGVNYTPTDNLSLTYTTSTGDPGVDSPGRSFVTMHSIIMDFAFGNGWNYILQGDLQYRESDAALAPGVFSGKQYGINQYLIRKINCRWSVGARMENFYAGEGFGAPLNQPLATPGSHYNALTFGLNYRPSASLVVKPELRYDWVDFDGFGATFANGTKRSQASIGVQSVWSW